MRDYLRCTTTFQLPEFCAQNSLSVPTQVFEECGVQSFPSPPPSPENEILARLMDFGFELVQSNLHPPPPQRDLRGSWFVETLSSKDTV